MARKPTGKPNGRPLKEIDKEQFEKLCALQCTLEEIAGFFRCSKDTVNAFCKREYGEGFSDTYIMYSQTGKVSLRRYQLELAKKSSAMAIFLGKQWLGQNDETDKEKEEGNKIEFIFKDASLKDE